MTKAFLIKIILFSIIIQTTSIFGKGPENCVPVAKWSGQLLFDEKNREEDGSIRIKIENTPEEFKSLKGEVLKLQFGKESSSARRWFHQQKMDVKFGKRALEKAKDLTLPVRLDGLKGVSPLESLAAARDNDKITVELRGNVIPSFEKIIIDEEPVLLEGTKRCLFKFVSTSPDDTAVVKEWNPKTRSFSGPEIIVNLDFRRDLPEFIDPESGAETINFSGIEEQQANDEGHNAYVDIIEGEVTVRAIEPYALFKAISFDSSKNVKKVRGKAARKDYWKIGDQDKGKVKQTLYQSKKTRKYQPERGQEFLMIHAFGSYNNHGMSLGSYRGHASMGFAKTVEHPITKELVYELIYKQTYAQNSKGTFASSMHWHAYSGDLYRGRMFHRPIQDILYPLDGLKGEIDGRNFKKELAQSIDEMAIKYRTGFGTGWAMVTILTSCSHDSGNILINKLNDFKKHLKGRREYRKERSLVDILKRKLGRAINPPEKFRNPDLLPSNIDVKPGTIFQARRNIHITIPRNFQDQTFEAFIRHTEIFKEHPVISLRTVQVGDELKGISPKAPDRLNNLLHVGVKFIQNFFKK